MTSTRGRLRRLAAVLAATVALGGTGIAVAAPASALSPVTFTVEAPSSTYVGDWITLGVHCATTCPLGLLDAKIAISGGPTLDLPAEPDYTTDWQVHGITSGYDNPDDGPAVKHTLTLTFTDETGSARTLTKQMQVNKRSPQPVENLAANDGMDATVTWDPPAIDGGLPITGYAIQVDEDPWTYLGAAATSFPLSGLAYGPHDVRVVPINGRGWGWGEPVTVLRGTMPSAPAVDVTGTAHPSLTWTESVAGGTSVTGYVVYAGGLPVRTLGAAARSVTLDDLDPGVQDLQVVATCKWGNGTFSTPVEWAQASAPSAVSTPTVAAGNGKLTVSWDAPSDDGGLPVTSYSVRVVDPTTRTVLGTATTAGTSVDVTGLLNGFAGLAQVAAVNEVGPSEWTDAASAVAPNGPAPAASSLTAAATDLTPSTTQKITLRGTLSITGKSEAGEKVQVWIKPYGASTWTKASTTTLTSTGAWSLTRAFSSRTAVQARYFGSVPLGAAQASSKVLTVVPSVAVSAKTTASSGATRTAYVLGQTIFVPVATSGAPAGAGVVLQKRSGSTWVTVATGKLSSGKVRLSWKPTVRATYSLRVMVKGSAAVAAGYSATMSRKVS